jgi:hypothetical protein
VRELPGSPGDHVAIEDSAIPMLSTSDPHDRRPAACSVKILVDLNISPHVVGLLRAAGFDAVRVGTDTLDPRASDEEVHPASHPHPTPR